jgi:plastocyanin
MSRANAPRGLLGLGVLALVALLSIHLSSPARAQTVTATIQGFAFQPATLTVTVGTTVTWTNKDTAAHTVTSDTGVFDSGNMPNGATYSFTFNQAGTFPYHCNYHSNMHGMVVVQSASATTAPAATATASSGSPAPTSTAGIPLRAVPAPSRQLIMGPALSHQQMAWWGYYDAHKDLYLNTDTSLKADAGMMHVNFAPGLKHVAAGTQPAIYLVQGRAAAGQIAVFGSEPGEADYSPIWREVVVQWKASSKPVVLKSDNQILDLSKKGQLTMRSTNTLLNCPIVKVGK